jgi:pyruvate kinase
MTHRKTKIVCTLGPATDSRDGIAELLDAGMDVVRLNFSHGDRDEHRATIRRVREVAAEADREVAILQDLAGPKIRLGELPSDGVRLEAGDSIGLGVEGHSATGDLPVNYPHLLDDVAAGETILLADGAAELEVLEVQRDRLLCRVLSGGLLTSRKGVNLPQANLRVAAFTDKDRADLEVGLAEGVDCIALSFVRHERDLEPVRARIGALENPPFLMAKIEKPQAVEVPMIQKQLIAAARRAGRPVITATQMLRSMVDSPRPLRAEASDVANAVLDGTDAVMLSEETAIGSYPAEAVRVLDRVARQAEPHLDHAEMLNDSASPCVPDLTGAVSRAACELAASIGAVAIVTTTTSGSTSRLLARLRPASTILGMTTSDTVARQLRLSWGVIPAVGEPTDDMQVLGGAIRREIVRHELGASGDRVVVIAGLPLGYSDSSNAIRVIELE